ncbi:MAG TPA: ABC transporter ATP-binding protein [Armatimonadota bacterium]|nr:ABC transporter ATP-binding protein [Armatimonadota bacterium]
MIDVRDLRVDYDDVCAVNDLTFSVSAGEIYGLIGPNGAGKTTTLRTMMGLQEPTYGDILLNGIDLATHREDAIASVGFMPDYSPIYDDLTVWEYLDLFAASYYVPIDRRKPTIEKYLEMVDLTEKRTAMTTGLSRGMKQRLMLAKTLLPEPKIVLLDEPASGMDPHARILLRNILRQLGEEGRAVLISSHILAELSEFCTSIGVMERGRMVISGRVDEVAERVLGQAEVCLEILAGHAQCEKILAADERVNALRSQGNSFSFLLTGNEEDASDILAALVKADVRVVSFGRKKEDLEEVFMKIGAKEVA